MRRFSFITLLCCLLLLLPGCRSKKSVVATPEGKEWVGGGPSGGKPSDKEISEIPDPMARALVQEAMKWIGTAYRFGGESRSGTDKSHWKNGTRSGAVKSGRQLSPPSSSEKVYGFKRQHDKKTSVSLVLPLYCIAGGVLPAMYGAPEFV